ncbi:hypothetical protein CLV78_106169 [Aliiruegeria haliotis]|uniref:Uncharacterized protein n=1 Tax=Aliiruegeria haliotis TaxID=1280846 RepID=A0A2T0RN95_9RHOB|nr:hypothetical protein [Aliiruegeria haliotis]PRY22628.1 hypothetical protein CLV78_106169 [Aliiruegeria haliotis]
MFLELIAAVAAGFFGAGAAMAANWLSGGRLPRWSMPVAAGACMIALAIRMEYAWFETNTADFPEGVEITSTRESSAFWRPWTYVWPMTDGFTAVDLASVRTNDTVPDQAMAKMFFFARWKAPREVQMVFDCTDNRIAPLNDTITFDDSGAVAEADWAMLPADDPTLTTVCKEIRP